MNFQRVRGTHPLKEADRICVLQFHNVPPLELERMTPAQLKGCCDDPRNHGIKAVVDLTFGYVDPAEVAAKAPAPGPAPAAEEKPKGLLTRLKTLLGSDKPGKRKKPKPKPKPKQPKPKPKKPTLATPAAKEPQTEKEKKAANWDSHRPDRYKL